MSRARAPGKVVLSGAYAVLHGAPAIVTAVARYVTVDTARTADLVTPEVRAALGDGMPVPWFDASALREAERKLGLGSSAAILVATLYALARDATPDASEARLRSLIVGKALVAHRAAQGGGSGVDVYASCLGGTLCYRSAPSGSSATSLGLPQSLMVELWTCPQSASTRELIGAVKDLAQRSTSDHERLMSAQAKAAEQAVRAAMADDGSAFVAALGAQHRALLELGHAAGVPIVTPQLVELAPAAEAEGGVLLPAGAGGGDIALFVGPAPSTPALRSALAQRAHHLLQVELGAPGVSAS